MRSDFVRVVRAAGVVGIVGVLGAASFRDRPARSVEVHRLRAHFDSVDTELRTRNVAGLTEAQLVRRATLIEWLREYRNAGVFPINDNFAGKQVPFFRDSRGTLCAMAYLIDRSGRNDIVDKIARTRNNAFIHELADDPELIQWLDENGLSVEEAARIQPAYGDEIQAGASAPFAISMIVLGGGSLALSVVNIINPTPTGEVAGLVVGAGAIVVGGTHLDKSGETKVLAYAGVFAGSVGVATSTIMLLRNRARHHSARSRETRVSLAPSIIPMQRTYQLGVVGTARF